MGRGNCRLEVPRGEAPGPEDRAHVETHVLLKCDAFIIDDGPLLVMCRWLREENGFAIKAMRIVLPAQSSWRLFPSR